MAQAANLPRLLSWYVLCKHWLEKQDTVILIACIQQIRLASFEHQYHFFIKRMYGTQSVLKITNNRQQTGTGKTNTNVCYVFY